FSLRMSGNYDRTTGVGEISGEPPLQGPIRWPMVSGTAAYDFGKPGRFSLDLQRSYYIEEILPGDNFGANIVALRWTKNFSHHGIRSGFQSFISYLLCDWFSSL